MGLSVLQLTTKVERLAAPSQVRSKCALQLALTSTFSWAYVLIPLIPQAMAQLTNLIGTVMLSTRSRALAQVNRLTGAVTVVTSALSYNPQCRLLLAVCFQFWAFKFWHKQTKPQVVCTESREQAPRNTTVPPLSHLCSTAVPHALCCTPILVIPLSCILIIAN